MLSLCPRPRCALIEHAAPHACRQWIQPCTCPSQQGAGHCPRSDLMGQRQLHLLVPRRLTIGAEGALPPSNLSATTAALATTIAIAVAASVLAAGSPSPPSPPSPPSTPPPSSRPPPSASPPPLPSSAWHPRHLLPPPPLLPPPLLPPSTAPFAAALTIATVSTTLTALPPSPPPSHARLCNRCQHPRLRPPRHSLPSFRWACFAPRSRRPKRTLCNS